MPSSTRGASWLEQLQAARAAATAATEQQPLRSLARRFGASDRHGMTVEQLRPLVLNALDGLIASALTERRRRQGSKLTLSSSSATSSRRSSVSSAARPAAAAAAAAASPAAAAPASPTAKSPAAPHAEPAVRTFAAVVTHSSAPTPAPNPTPQAAAAMEAPSPGERVRSPAGPATTAAMQQLQQQVSDLSSKVDAAESTIADLHRSNEQLRRQLQASAATTIRLESRVEASELQIQELLAAQLKAAETADTVSMLHSRQEQLQQRQRLAECQHSVVFKSPTPLPAAGTAQHLQQQLRKLLGFQLTVQAVQPLGSKQPGSGGSSSGARSASKHAYKVVLGSSGERTEVMRVKAQRLRGTVWSIDELLTPDQLASRQRLQPVARQAAAAGQRVRWHHGSLLIDGKRYTGPGSLPTPTEQQAAAAAKASHHSKQQPTPRAVPAAEADGWQTVARRGKQPKRPAAASSKKALFAEQPRKQQQRGNGGQKQGGGSKPPAKPKGAKQLAAQPKVSPPKSSSGSGMQRQPAGGAGGALARVASLGEGQGASSAPTADPAAGHGVSPPSAKSPPAAARGGSERQPETAAGSTGGKQPPAAAAGAASPLPSPSARA